MVIVMDKKKRPLKKRGQAPFLPVKKKGPVPFSDVEERIMQKREAVEEELRRILSGDESFLFRVMRYAVLSGGKRFRPLLTLAAGECFGASRESLLPFACGLELIHNYSLIHDDLPSMDNDDFRRGQPSCHRAFGEDAAILAGDSLLTLAFEVMARAPLDSGRLQRKVDVLNEVSRMAGVRGMVGGQLMDVTLPAGGLSEETFHELIRKKTGALITAAVRIGAILGGAKPAELEALTEYGQNVGLAFQIRDDILDSVSEAASDPPRPNYVACFGLEKARQRLAGFVERGRRALQQASPRSEELHYLASRLLELEHRKER